MPSPCPQHFNRHTVAQQAVDSLGVALQRAAMVIGFGADIVESRAELRGRVTRLGQPCGEHAILDVAVIAAFG